MMDKYKIAIMGRLKLDLYKEYAKMNVLSNDLALVLMEYNELPESIRKSLDYRVNDKSNIRLKGDLLLFKNNENYLYVYPDLFKKSKLTAIYGNKIDRTNEDSFDTLLCLYFNWFCKSFNVKPTEIDLEKYVGGMDVYTSANSVENLWHIINLAKQCIEDSFQPNFSSLLSFYSIIELLVLNDCDNRTNGNYITDQCGRKLPYFHKKLSYLSCPALISINKSLSEAELFIELTKLRHKVIHGIFHKARQILNVLFPISSVNGQYMGNTEDAESSAFQDQMQNLNMLIRSELAQILHEWMISPDQIAEIKNDINFSR